MCDRGLSISTADERYLQDGFALVCGIQPIA
jgi:hypothetical protein